MGPLCIFKYQGILHESLLEPDSMVSFKSIDASAKPLSPTEDSETVYLFPAKYGDKEVEPFCTPVKVEN